MTRETLIVQIFVASPSDVEEERVIVDSVVAELNRTWQNSLGVAFEVVKWETHVRPGFGDDAQDVINRQVVVDYDIFIGIFWSRLGTPTSRAESGSVEEFERAYARWLASEGTPEIMVYIKDAPISPSKIVGAQFTSLEAFKARLSDKGGLLFNFKDQSGFESSLRAHLSSLAQKFSSARRGPTASSAPARHSTSTRELLIASSADSEEYGLLDYIDVYTTRMSNMTEAAASIGEATRRLGEHVSQRTIELNNPGRDLYGKRRILKLASDDMFRFSSIVDVQISVMSQARQEAFSALSNALALMPDFPSERAQLPTLRAALLGNIEAVRYTKAQMIGLEQSAAGLPRISKELNKGKRVAAGSAAKVVAELDSVETTVINLVEAIDRLLDEP